MLIVEDLVVRYGEIEALRGVSLEVRGGETVALVGANGAGKTSLLRAVSGLARPAAGTIRFADDTIHGLAAEEIVRRGLVHLPEGRAVLTTLTEGKNRELRNVFASRNIRVKRIHRLRIGPVTLSGLPLGHSRRLTGREVRWFLARSERKQA